MKLALFGGSYDPVHLGHLLLADAVHRHAGYDRVLFVPTFVSPFKEKEGSASAHYRVRMLHLAIGTTPYFSVEECEIRRGGISYTAETVQHVREKYGAQLEGKLALVLGEDAARSVPHWHAFDSWSTHVDFVVGARPVTSGDGGNVERATRTLQSFPFPWVSAENVALPISSTYIRTAIQRGRSWGYLVPSPVREYIIARGLYRS